MLANTAAIYRHTVFVERKRVILKIRGEFVDGRGFGSSFQLFKSLELLYTHILLNKSHSEPEKRSRTK